MLKLKTENHELETLTIKAQIYDEIAQIGMLRNQITKREQTIIELEGKLSKMEQSDEK